MVFTIIISTATILLMISSILFFPKIKIGKIHIDTYWIITLLGATTLFLFNRLGMSEYLSSLSENNSINPIKIIILFFSMTLLSLFLDEVGFFKYVALLCVNKAKSSQFSIFTLFYFIISILTVFTSNDIIILVFTPFICYFAKHTKINPIPYLVAEFVAANTLSMALLIGNPTNIYLSLSSSISFMEYFKVMFINSIIVCLVTYILLLLIFRKDLKKEIVKENEDIKISNKIYLIFGLVHLILCTICLAISSYLNIEMYLLAIIFALSLVICIFIYEMIFDKKAHHILDTIKRIPYALIPFLFSMFAIVLALENQGIVDKIAKLLNKGNDVINVGVTSFISCSFMNNIPMSVLYSNILNNGTFSIDAIYAAIGGSNLGAILSPIGALAGIMWINIINDSETKFEIKDFIKYCTPLSIILMGLFLILL